MTQTTDQLLSDLRDARKALATVNHTLKDCADPIEAMTLRQRQNGLRHAIGAIASELKKRNVEVPNA